MFAVRRIIRSKLSLKNHIYTSATIRCDKPKDRESEVNQANSKGNKSIKENEPKLGNKSQRKEQLTAELNAQDYANFKSHKKQAKVRKVELYADTTSQEEKLKAKKSLENLKKNVEKEVNSDIPANENLKSLAIGKQVQNKGKKGFGEKLVESARAVASEMGGDAKKTESDILGYLKKVKPKSGKKFGQSGEPPGDKQQIPRGFKSNEGRNFRGNEPGLMRNRWKQPEGKEEQKMKRSSGGPDFKAGVEDGKGHFFPRSQRNESRIVNSILRRGPWAESLRIFTLDGLEENPPKLRTWDELEEFELQMASTVPPRNYFEELIQWTNEGKLWHFPIDNDQGNDEEANVDFTEHVFLEEHLEPWCPKRGPLRHFMELVLTGLGKNHYLSVEEKKEHILWYRDYFEGKKKLLQEMGALDAVRVLKKPEESKSEPENPT